MAVLIEALNVYPAKSCKGKPLTTARLSETGFEHDRRWMFVNAAGRFLTQRELPQLALVDVEVTNEGVRFSAPGIPSLDLTGRETFRREGVTVWRDKLSALDEGDQAAQWASSVLGSNVRLVQFDPNARRLSNRQWTGDVDAPNMFSDGYPILLLSQASLQDLNSRLPSGAGPLPMNRFRPNIVVSGLDAYDEDNIHELRGEGICLRIVKPCTRCKITTTNQATGAVEGEEPIATLKSYRWNAELQGVCFGQNVIVIDGVGKALSVGQELKAILK